ncbi:MAG: response regulator [bacterium]|nr:response regulator [bacterium]
MGAIRILILEDDNDIIDLIRSVLEGSGGQYEFCQAGNGSEGLQVAIQAQPDLIICDIMMPVMDGREFVRRLRAMPEFIRIPVIFLSALGSREQITDGYQLGAALYLTKPIDGTRLRRNIELFIRDHEIKPRPKRFSLDQLPGAQVPPPLAVLVSRPGVKPTAGEGPGEPPPAGGRKEVRPESKGEEPVDDWVIKPHATPAGTPAGRARKPKIRVMVVEDDPDASEMIRIGLGDDYEVIETVDGISAIEQSVRYKPDVFIIDGILPRMTGYQLTMMLKKNRLFYRSPIIFISGKASDRDQQYVLRLGVSHFLAKPFTVKQLTAIMDRIVTAPNFEIHTDRIDSSQIFLEKFQQIETHRTSNPALDRLERRSDKIHKEVK